VPRLLTLLILAALTACAPRTLPPAAPRAADFIAGISADLPHATISRDGDGPITHNVITVCLHRPTTPLATHRLSSLGLTLLTFDSRSHALLVLDNEGGPGTGATSSKSAAQSSNAIAAINGGFFTPEGHPLGLLYENGKKYGDLNTSSLGAGIYLHDPKSLPTALLRRSAWPRDHSSWPPQYLLQSGPFLLENSRPVSGLSSSRPRERSFLLWDGHSGWALGHSSSTTLADLAKTLATQPLPGFTIQHALNLDGGSSADLWISPSVKGGPASTRHLWNKNVRNYLVLNPR